jgi:two-component system sensor histidine kinase PilS (NtrC family)
VTITRQDTAGDTGTPVRITAIFTDISATKRIEQLRLRAERLEGVAELSASLARDQEPARVHSQLGGAARPGQPVPPRRAVPGGLIVRE